MVKSTSPKIEKVICATCLRETRHTLRDTYNTNWEEEVDTFTMSGGSTHDFLECNGCSSPTLRISSWCSEGDGTEVKYFPPRAAHELVRQPKSFEQVGYGTPLDSVYRQTITAFNLRLLTLAGTGVRLLIEGVCKKCNIHDGEVAVKANGIDGIRKSNLEGRISGLAEEGLITYGQAEALHQIRFLGNDAAHDLDHPSEENVGIALDIVEHLIEQVFEQPERVKVLAKRRQQKDVISK